VGGKRMDISQEDEENELDNGESSVKESWKK
jgi:hypothetical protein